jgi:hypothetical protein
MQCFSILAEKTIRTSADGRRVLALYGPFARPYDVSGPDTEERVIRRLTGAYRALTIPGLAILAFLSHRPDDAHAFFGGFVAFLSVGWLMVWLILRSELRWLRRVDRTPCDRPSSIEFVSQLNLADRALLRWRRRSCLWGFLGSGLYAAGGVAMVFKEPAFGYLAAVFFGWCAVRWWGMFRLPAEAVLEMRSNWLFHIPYGDVDAQPSSSDFHEVAKLADPSPGLAPMLSTLWDRELDAHPQPMP